MSQQTIHVHGYHVFSEPASKRLKTYSALVDLCISVSIWVLVLSSFKITLFPNVKVISALFGIIFFYWFPQKVLFGVTWGERIWKLRPHQNTWYNFRETVYQPKHRTKLDVFLSSVLSTSVIVVSLIILNQVTYTHPLWMEANIWKMQPFLPKAEEWIVTPFFYTLGGWPKYFLGNPIFYKLVYEKGPPTQFIGHIYGYWEAPDIQLILEGPKTPPSVGDPLQVKHCLTEGGLSYSCLMKRDAILGRHISEIESISPKKWMLKWFTVDYPLLPTEEQTQGIYLNAQGEDTTQDRFILINSAGRHQAIILSRPNNANGEKAFQLVQKVVRSIRNFGELDSGRAWINRELEKIQLSDLNTVSDPIEIASRLAFIQTLLISKISVEPAYFDSYFHLAGTSFMLSKISKINHNVRNSAALQNLQSSYRFASDINPKDPRTLQIQDLWLESRKE